VKVLTWNLWWRFGDWRARQDAITTVLLRENPDVCFLQEVWLTPDGGLAQELAGRIGFDYAVAASPCPARWHVRAQEPETTGVGSAVLSRWPITQVEQEALPAGAVADEGRFILHAVVDAPSGPLALFGVHLNSGPADSAVRVEQVRHLARYLADRRGDGHPPIIAGDLNALPESDEVRLLEGVLTAPVVPGQILVDAWRYADPDDVGLTWDRRNPHVAAKPHPSGRIDYVFVAPEGSDGRGRVLGTRLVGNGPEGGTWPSDHHGVLVDLSDGAPVTVISS
jgi:endonuclease/exonuclease/phosphatase family metal-dependent hydrolase